MSQYRYNATGDVAWKTKFLATQADAGCLAVRPSSSYLTQFVVGGYSLQNRTGGLCAMGMAGRLPISLWKAGQIDNTGAFTDDTTNAQSGTADAFSLGTASSNTSGIIVLCRIPVNLLSVLLTTVASGGAPAFDLAYSTGTATWTAITNPLVAPDWTQGNGEQLVWWEMPGADWAVVAAGHGTGLPTDGAGWYGLRIRETVAGTVSAGKASRLILGISVDGSAGWGANQLMTRDPALGELELPPQCDGLAAVFSVSNDGNRVAARYRLKG